MQESENRQEDCGLELIKVFMEAKCGLCTTEVFLESYLIEINFRIDICYVTVLLVCVCCDGI